MIAAFGEIVFDVYPDRERLGGAPFNLIYHIIRLTGKGALISRVGNDERGQNVQKFLSDRHLDIHGLQIDSKKPTGTAVVQLNQDGIPSFTITGGVAYDAIATTPEAEALVESCELFYFGTLAQRSMASQNTLYQIVRRAKQSFLDVNLRQNFYSADLLRISLELADVVKLNYEELRIIDALLFSETFSIEAAALRLIRTFSLLQLAVTLGNEGSWIFAEGEKTFHQTTIDHVVDTVGAGDGFAAIMCAGRIAGWTQDMIHRTASEFSAALCGIEGALPEDDRFYEPFRSLFSHAHK
ncbi:carbohydrate kinase [bacterium]|nr:carbohydrate kinase [bacterium]